MITKIILYPENILCVKKKICTQKKNYSSTGSIYSDFSRCDRVVVYTPTPQIHVRIQRIHYSKQIHRATKPTPKSS